MHHGSPPFFIQAAASRSDLTPGEARLVQMFRRWLMGAHDVRIEHWALLWGELSVWVGPAEGKSRLINLAGLMRELAEHGRHPIRFLPVGCPHLGLDEAWLVGIVRACRHGDWDYPRLLAEWMVRDDGVGDVIGAASGLASILGAVVGSSEP
jgi:hypothetical protein